MALKMNKAEIKEKINTEIEKTKKIIAEYKELSKPVAPDASIGRVSRMDAINNKSVTEASLRQLESKLNGLKRVLAQYDTKEFGICIKCKKAIPLGRILFMPQSPYCVNCAE